MKIAVLAHFSVFSTFFLSFLSNLSHCATISELLAIEIELENQYFVTEVQKKKRNRQFDDFKSNFRNIKTVFFTHVLYFF